jgi:hypothetical protein
MELSNHSATPSADLDRPEGDAYLSAVLPVLWPAPARVSRTSRRRHRDGASAHLVLPSSDRPKLLVPSRPGGGEGGAV